MATSAHTIQDALRSVSQLRQQQAQESALRQASRQLKRFQARRFQATYSDLLHSPRYQPAAAFFLHELYGDKDYAERDQQFARIAATIARLFPQSVVDTAAALAQVHALTETLDDLMARHWLADQAANPARSECARYVLCWRQVGQPAERQRQLQGVLALGQQLDRLTRMRGLRTLLKMMRAPASAADLSALQHFLESGFDAFAQMGSADEFLQRIAQRESEWLRLLFDASAETCETRLAHLLGAGAPT
ncbi:MAG: FFLEELY motif protein [Polaromonas sp.]